MQRVASASGVRTSRGSRPPTGDPPRLEGPRGAVRLPLVHEPVVFVKGEEPARSTARARGERVVHRHDGVLEGNVRLHDLRGHHLENSAPCLCILESSHPVVEPEQVVDDVPRCPLTQPQAHHLPLGGGRAARPGLEHAHPVEERAQQKEHAHAKVRQKVIHLEDQVSAPPEAAQRREDLGHHHLLVVDLLLTHASSVACPSGIRQEQMDALALGDLGDPREQQPDVDAAAHVARPVGAVRPLQRLVRSLPVERPPPVV